MESLESKLDRLTPEQRRKAEDFVDFLLSRMGQVPPLPGGPVSQPPLMSAAPPPFITPEPVHNTGSYLAGPQASVPADNPPARGALPAESAPAPFHEIGGGIQNQITHDYMDYGKFENQTSPATDAVKKIKRKIAAQKKEDKPHHLLDWVD